MLMTSLGRLGIVGQLPAFQGNVPVGLKAIKKDANITVQGATGWIDALDPLYVSCARLRVHEIIVGVRMRVRVFRVHTYCTSYKRDTGCRCAA